MSGGQIAAEVFQALVDVAKDVGDGEFTVTLRKPPAPQETPWDTPSDSETEHELPALVSSYSMTTRATAYQVDGTLILADDRKVMLPSTGVVPTPDDKLVIGDHAYTIMSVNEAAPSGVTLYYILHCRR